MSFIPFQRNARQARPTNNRRAYQALRRDIRRIRRDAPNHLDVRYYEESLSLAPFRTDPVVRSYYSGAGWCELPLPTGAAPRTAVYVAITGPVGRLP